MAFWNPERWRNFFWKFDYLDLFRNYGKITEGHNFKIKENWFYSTVEWSQSRITH